MLTSFIQDRVDDTTFVREAFAERPGKPLKIRVQPMVLRNSDTQRSQYRSWPDVSWTLQCESVEEAFELREAMRTFFAALAARGTKKVLRELNKNGHTTREKTERRPNP